MNETAVSANDVSAFPQKTEATEIAKTVISIVSVKTQIFFIVTHTRESAVFFIYIIIQPLTGQVNTPPEF